MAQRALLSGEVTLVRLGEPRRLIERCPEVRSALYLVWLGEPRWLGEPPPQVRLPWGLGREDRVAWFVRTN